MNTSPSFILAIHIVIGVFIIYLSYLILEKRQIPNFIGMLLMIFISVFLIVINIYIYKNTNNDKSQEQTKLRGFNVDPNDSRFKPIGGVPGGVTWV
jgi:branched-subunit amino acid transport protein AzlD